MKSVVHLPPSQQCTVQYRQSRAVTHSPPHLSSHNKAVPVTNCCFTSHHQPPALATPSQRTASQQPLNMLEEKTSLLSLSATGDHCCYVVSSALFIQAELSTLNIFYFEKLYKNLSYLKHFTLPSHSVFLTDSVTRLCSVEAIPCNNPTSLI